MNLLSRRPPDPASRSATLSGPDRGRNNLIYPGPVTKVIDSVDRAVTAKWLPINKSFTTLTKIILKAASARSGLVNIAVTLRCVTQQGHRHLLLVNDGQDNQLAGLGDVEEFIISTETPMTPAAERLHAAGAITLPLDFQQQRLGYIVALARNPAESSGTRESEAAVVQDVRNNLAGLAGDIVAIIRRYQTRYRAIYVYGDQCYWIGNSVALRQLDQRISVLARSPMPVLIRGNKGSGKMIAARALHCERHADIVPFIEADCGTWELGAAPNILQALTIYARGGTLFLRNIDKLSPTNLQCLQRFCVLSAADNLQRESQEGLDLIFSLSQRDIQITSLVKQWLELNTLELLLPNLHERCGDLRDLARFFIYQYAINNYPDFTEDAWHLLEARPWVGNVDELKGVIQQLTAIIDVSLVNAAQLKLFLPR